MSDNLILILQTLIFVPERALPGTKRFVFSEKRQRARYGGTDNKMVGGKGSRSYFTYWQYTVWVIVNR